MNGQLWRAGLATATIALAVTLTADATVPAPTQLIGIREVSVDVTVDGDLKLDAKDVTRRVVAWLSKRGMQTTDKKAPTLAVEIQALHRACDHGDVFAIEVGVNVRDDVTLRRDPSIELQRWVVTWSKHGLIIATDPESAAKDSVDLIDRYVSSFLDDAEWVRKRYR